MSCSLQEKWHLEETDLAVIKFLKIALLCFKPLWILDTFKKLPEVIICWQEVKFLTYLNWFKI